jgi:Protein of unknown function (DUF4446)
LLGADSLSSVTPIAASLTDTEGIVALAAAALALAALATCVAMALRMRSLRAAQRVLLGAGEHDLVGHAAALQSGFEDLREYVGEVAKRLDERLAAAERGAGGAISHHALVRYDAYNELSGRQSVSLALLDDERSGIVLTCIHHREQARVYVKRVQQGRSELELSPEEAQAVGLALSPAGDEAHDVERLPAA